MSAFPRVRLWLMVALLGLAGAVLPRSVSAQIAFDAASSSTGNLLTMSWSHTVGTGSQRLLVVGLTIRNGLNLGTSVSYGGVGLTLLRANRNHDNAVRAEMWYLKNPASGTANVTVTLLGAAKMAAGAVSFSGVDQTTTFGAVSADSSTNTGTTDPTTTVASATGSVVIDVAAMTGDAAPITAGAGQTQRWTNTTGSSGGEIRGAGSTEPGAASVTMSWTKTGNAKWAIIAASINGQPNTAPTLNNTKTPVLTAENEDAGAPSGAVGTLVSSLVDFASPSGQVDNVTDPDAGALLGVAVTAADATNGSWWYSTNNGGSWSALGSVSSTSARLLAADANSRLYFQPNADYNGTIASAITFRAWDQTTGTNGSLADPSTNGGATAFSTATDVAALTINAVNDAPTLGNGTLASVSEDTSNPSGQSVSTIFSGQFSDIDAGSSLGGIAVVSNSANAGTEGTWQYSTNSGTNWFAIGTVTDGSTALAISASTLIRFVPVANYNGTPTALTVRGLDNTYAGGFSTTAGSESRVTVNTSTNGGTTAIAAATATLSTSITAVNDAPTLDNTKTPVLTAENEDAGAPSGAVGTLVSSLVDFASPSGQVDNVTDPDAGALLGLAVTAADVTNGSWFYSTNNGGSWSALGSVSGTSARLLAADANSRLYFQPNADYNGTIASAITFRAWDQTTGTNGTLADPSTNGGSTAFSTATDVAALTITAVNDAPVITSNGGGATASVNVAENTTAVTTVAATDVDGPSLTYSISGGADAAKFTINSSSGVLAFLSAPSYSSPTDAGANNVYDVTVQVSDGSLTDTQAIAVTIQGTAIMSLGNVANPMTPVPNQDVTFTATHNNIGSIAATSLVTVEDVPANTDFKLSSASFSPGSSGLTAAVAYSNNGGATYVYVPVSGAGGAPAGYDRTVTHLRWSMTGNLSPTSPNNSYAVSFQVRVR